MRMVIYRGTGPVSLLGNRDGVNLATGAQVDLDRVIGEGPTGPLTVGAALGHLVALCTPIEPEAPASPRPRHRAARTPADPAEE